MFWLKNFSWDQSSCWGIRNWQRKPISYSLSVDYVKSTQAVSVRIEILVGKSYTMLTPWEIIRFLTGDFKISKIDASDLFWEAAWPRLLETQNRSVAQVLLDLKSHDRVLMISESVSILHALPTNIFVHTRTTGGDFTKSTERLERSCFALPNSTPSMSSLKLSESKHNL